MIVPCMVYEAVVHRSDQQDQLRGDQFAAHDHGQQPPTNRKIRAVATVLNPDHLASGC